MKPPSFSVKNFQVSAPSATLSFNGHIIEQQWEQFDLSIKNFDLGLLKKHEFLDLEMSGWASADINLKGALAHPTGGNIQYQIEKLNLKGQNLGRIEGLATLNEKNITISQMTIENPSGKIEASAVIPIHKKSVKKNIFSLELKSHQFDLTNILNGFSEINNKAVFLTSQIKIERNENKFLAYGPLHLSAQELVIPSLGMTINNVHFQLEGEGEKLNVKNAQAFSGKKEVLSVVGSFSQKGPDLKMKADHLPFELPVGIKGKVTSDLLLVESWEEPFLKGKIDIIQADFNPDKQKKSKSKKDKPSPEKKSPSPLKMDLTIFFDRNVWYKKRQTSIELKGNLNIRKESHDEPHIFGKVEKVRGSYVLYGRVFKLERGQIHFSGQNPVNPTLDIKAVYIDDVSRIRVYFTVSGDRNNPIISLTSEPPLEEADIISVLVMGRPLYEIGDENKKGDSSDMAQNVVAGYLSEELRQQIQDTIDLDVLRVKMKDQQVSDVVVGKNVTNDLFVSYGQTLGPGGEQRVQAEYYLTPIWNLEGYTTSAGRYVIDLLFKFGFE